MATLPTHYHLADYGQPLAGKPKICRSFPEEFGVTLFQRNRKRFAVRYGKEVWDHLPYAEAAARLGEALMHALACSGDLDSGA